jgi:hypothetical protein
MESRPEFISKNRKIKRRFAVKTTYITAAQCLLFLAASLTAAAQPDVKPDHSSNQSSEQISASAREAQIRVLQAQLEGYNQQLRAKAELVEDARQEAISAGIQGDGAGPFIDASRQEQKELETLQAALAPQIERTGALLASLANPVSPADASLNQVRTPARPARALVTASNSHEIH